MSKPSFAVAWSLFQQVNVSVKKVGLKIGGKVGQNIAANVFANACPIRMSYVLNHVGIAIPASGYAVSSGADGKWYMYHVNDMMTFLRRRFGKPDKEVARPRPPDFAGMKGILVVQGQGWSNARGHVTLWDGTRCSDHCHLMSDPDNGSFAPSTAALWKLP